MARDDKPLRLRPVDEDGVEEPTPVVRLDNRETESRAREAKPIRLGPAPDETNVNRRLVLPDKEEIELRTHQPGIDVLIEAETANPDLLEEKWGEESIRKNPVPWGWFALIGLIITGAVIWSVTRVNKAEDQAQQIRSVTRSTMVDEENEEREAALLVDRIDKTIRSFFTATSVSSLNHMIRQPERVIPLMKQYYRNGTIAANPVRNVKGLQPLTLDNRGNFWMATTSLTNGKTQNLIIEIDGTGTPKIDWETLVCYQPMKWDDFVSQRPAGTSLDFRVYAERDNFYSHEFSDSKQWISFRLTSLDSDETVFGYARAGSTEAMELLDLLVKNNGRKSTVILRLSIPEGLRSHRGVVIEKLMSPRWLYLDPPESDP